MLDFVEETFDQVAFAVEREVTQALGGSICFGWNDDVRAACGYHFNDSVTVVTLVGQHIFRGDAFQEWLGLCAIGDIARREDEPQRISQGIAQRM